MYSLITHLSHCCPADGIQVLCRDKLGLSCTECVLQPGVQKSKSEAKEGHTAEQTQEGDTHTLFPYSNTVRIPQHGWGWSRMRTWSTLCCWTPQGLAMATPSPNTPGLRRWPWRKMCPWKCVPFQTRYCIALVTPQHQPLNKDQEW